LHIAIDEDGKIVAFRFANGSRHDVREAENLLRGRMGTAIGDKGYCLQQLKTRLAKTALRLIAHARKNMKNGNTPKTETRQKKNSSFADEISWNESSLSSSDIWVIHFPAFGLGKRSKRPLPLAY
jgi:hypothetical protein